MIEAMITGKLVADPVQRTAANGNAFWTATARVPAGADAVFVGITAFDETAAARLARLAKGSAVTAVGELQATSWTGKDGTERKGWRLTAHELLSVAQARGRRNSG